MLPAISSVVVPITQLFPSHVGACLFLSEKEGKIQTRIQDLYWYKMSNPKKKEMQVPFVMNQLPLFTRLRQLSMNQLPGATAISAK